MEGSGEGGRVGANGRRGGCGAQHSVHTNSTVSKRRGSPLPDEWRGGRAGERGREEGRKEWRWTEDLKMNGERRNAGERRDIQ